MGERWPGRGTVRDPRIAWGGDVVGEGLARNPAGVAGERPMKRPVLKSICHHNSRTGNGSSLGELVRARARRERGERGGTKLSLWWDYGADAAVQIVEGAFLPALLKY